MRLMIVLNLQQIFLCFRGNVMSKFNSFFTDFIDEITPIINTALNKYSWSSFMNGYYKGKNDVYFIGYKQSGKMFPIVITLKMEFPWALAGNYGRIINSIDYSNDKEGMLLFDKIFTFSFYVDEEYIGKHNLDGLTAEFTEFKDVPVEKFVLDLRDKSKVHRFTRKQKDQIGKWAEAAGKNILLNIQDGIGKQVARRFEEFVKVDEQLAMKHAPQEVKDIFVF